MSRCSRPMRCRRAGGVAIVETNVLRPAHHVVLGQEARRPQNLLDRVDPVEKKVEGFVDVDPAVRRLEATSQVQAGPPIPIHSCNSSLAESAVSDALRG